MESRTILEILDAAHLTKHINSPFKQRGGIMLVGPPASLKTTFIQNVYDEHYDTLVVSDINIQTLMKLRSDFRTGRYSTLAFTEFSKIYARRGDTAENLEAAIHQLVEEGFTKPSFVDQRMSSTRARCLVVGAMTEHCYEEHYNGWNDSGFLRRFLWVQINVSNGFLLMDAIARWRPLELGDYKTKSPGNKFISMLVDEKESEHLKMFLKDQPGTTTPFVLLKKILSVLKWKYDREDPKKAMRIIEDFSDSLRTEGGDIVLREDEVKREVRK